MQNLVYLNFLIENAWGNDGLKRIFPVQSPQNEFFARAHDQFGIYFCEPGDWVVTSSEIDEQFREFLNDNMKLDGIGTQKLSNLLTGREKKLAFAPVFSGVSASEALLASKTLDFPLGVTENEFRRWNDKRFLFNLCRRLEIPFPETTEVTEDLPLPKAGNWLLKAAVSAGGSGILDCGSDVEGKIKFLRRMQQASGVSLAWLLQEKYERTQDFYVLCEVGSEGKPEISGLFTLEVAENLSSSAHRGGVDPEYRGELEKTALRIGAELSREGYRGSFGIDAFATKCGKLFPAVDLNVRIDKCRAIFMAARRYGVAPEEISVARARLIYPINPNFEALWTEWRKVLELDPAGQGAGNQYCIPLLFLRYGDDVVEFTWMAGVRGASASSSEVVRWSQETSRVLKRFSGS